MSYQLFLEPDAFWTRRFKKLPGMYLFCYITYNAIFFKLPAYTTLFINKNSFGKYHPVCPKNP